MDKNAKKAATLILAEDKAIKAKRAKHPHKERVPATTNTEPVKETMLHEVSGRHGYKPFCGKSVALFKSATARSQQTLSIMVNKSMHMHVRCFCFVAFLSITESKKAKHSNNFSFFTGKKWTKKSKASCCADLGGR